MYIFNKAQKKEEQLYQHIDRSNSAILFHYSILQVSVTFSPVGSTSLLDNRHSKTLCFGEVQKSPRIVKKKNNYMFPVWKKVYLYRQLLGLEEGTTTAHREHMVQRGACLSLLFLYPLRSP